MGRVTDDPGTWGAASELSINGSQLPVFGASAAQLTIVRDTLSLIPVVHLATVTRVVIGEVVGGGKIREGGNSVSRLPNPRLEVATNAMNNPKKLTLGRDRKTMIHKTLLHETGHHVDWRLGITRGLTPQTLKEIDSWFATLGYGGVTRGAGEARAELYWRLFANRSSLPASVRTAVALKLGIV